MRAYRVVTFILVFLLLGELALEARARLRGFDTLLLGTPRTDAALQATGDRFGPTDDFPFRSPLPREESAPGLTIWLASASYAEDSYLPADQIFPYLTQVELDSLGYDALVLNSSRAGWNIASNLAVIDTLAGKWSPDVLLLYHGSTDVSDLLNRSGTTDHAGADAPPAEAPQGFTRWVGELGESTTLYQLLKANLTTRVTAARLLETGIPASADSVFRSTIERFVQRARDLEARPVLVTFATRAVPGETLDLADEDFILRWSGRYEPGEWLAAVDELNRVIREVGEREDIPVIELAAEMTGRKSLYRDLVHFTPGGHRRVAEVLSRGLVPVLEELSVQRGTSR